MALDYNADDEEIDERNAKRRTRDILTRDEGIEPGPNPISCKLASFWKDQIEEVEKEDAKWIRVGNQIIKRFRDERNKAQAATERRMNLLWANFKILKPALYGKKPIPIVERKFLDRDPTGRLSAMMLERALRNELEDNGLHENISRAVNDYLLPGRGVTWVRYEPEIGPGVSLPYSQQSVMEDQIHDILEEEGLGEDETDEDEKLEDTGERLISERALVDYIDWRDFKIFPCTARVWSEVQAVAKRVSLTRQECIERFGEDIGEDIQPDVTAYGDNNQRKSYETSAFQDINERNIVVYEIWNKTDRRVYWVSPGYDYLCDVRKDPLKLKKFFPVPEPISSTLTNDSLYPIPDYTEWQDQAIQIDELTQRIALLTKACKVAGTYDSSQGAVKRLLSEGTENTLIPVDSWAVFAENGGVKGAISFLPIDEIQKVIETLIKVRQQAMQDLDIVTGISDILRGTTDSRETLGGIRLKNNNAGTRLSDRQNDIVRFAKENVQLIAEIMAKHFSDETIINCSGILFEEEMQPEFVLEEFEAEQPDAPPLPPTGPMPAPNMGGPVPVPGNPPFPAPAPNMGVPAPIQPPMMGNNVIPFNPAGGGVPFPPLMPPVQPDPTLLIAQKLEKAFQLIHDEITFGYRIDIETDSTIFGDAMQERQDATEFITAVTAFMEKAAMASQMIPESVGLFGRMLQFGVRKFRTGRDLEAAIDTFVRQMDKKLKKIEKQGPPPDPEAEKAKLEQEKIQQQMQHDATMRQMEMQAQRENDIRDAQKQQAEDQRQAQISQMEMQLAQMKHQMEREKLEMQKQMLLLKHQIEMAKLNAEIQKMQVETTLEAQQTQTEAALKERELSNEVVMQEREFQNREREMELNAEQQNRDRQFQNQQHKDKMAQQKEQAKSKQTQMKQKQNETKKKGANK